MVRPANPIHNHTPSLSAAAPAAAVRATAVPEAQAAIATTPLHRLQQAWGNKDLRTLSKFKGSAWLNQTPLPKIVQGMFKGIETMPLEKGPALHKAVLPTSYPQMLINAQKSLS